MGFELSPMWEIYDSLIDSVPAAATVAEVVSAQYWVAVKSSLGGTGVAHILPHPDQTPLPDPSSLIGRSLKDVARTVKSWDETETATGLAAITASANSALLAAGLTADSPQSGQAAFDKFLELARDKKVAVVGHFPNLEPVEKVAREFFILERQPQAGDLPDTAAEYLLPDMEVVFITGSALVNKSLPRLLELAGPAFIGLVGPSVPLCPSLFDYSVNCLSGTVFNDYPKIARAVLEGRTTSLFKYGGFRVNLEPGFCF